MMLDDIPNEVRAYIKRCLENRHNLFDKPIIVVLVHGHPDAFGQDTFEQISKSDNRFKVKQRYMVSGITAHELGDTLEELRAKVSAQRSDDWIAQGEPRMWNTPNHTRTWYTQMLAKIICTPLSEEDLKLRGMFRRMFREA